MSCWGGKNENSGQNKKGCNISQIKILNIYIYMFIKIRSQLHFDVYFGSKAIYGSKAWQLFHLKT